MIKYRILPEYKLVVFCSWGVTPVEDVMEMSKRLRIDPDFVPSYDGIFDNTRLEHHYTSEEMRMLAERRMEKNPSNGRLAVISPDDVVFGMSRMHQLISEDNSPVQINVFRDAESALKWLNKTGIDIESILKEIREEA